MLKVISFRSGEGNRKQLLSDGKVLPETLSSGKFGERKTKDVIPDPVVQGPSNQIT